MVDGEVGGGGGGMLGVNMWLCENTRKDSQWPILSNFEIVTANTAITGKMGVLLGVKILE